jgi:hypothetical protein
VWKGLGLDRFPHLRDAYFGNYSELLYLRQTNGEGETTRAQAAAAKMGLTFAEAETGLTELESRLVALVDELASRRTQP